MIEYQDPRGSYPDSWVTKFRRIYLVGEVFIHYVDGFMRLVMWYDDKWQFGLHSISKMPDNPPRVTCMQSPPDQVPPPSEPLNFHGIAEYTNPHAEVWSSRMKRWGWLDEAA